MDGGNPFGYCGSNPVNDVDADGRRRISDAGNFATNLGLLLVFQGLLVDALSPGPMGNVMSGIALVPGILLVVLGVTLGMSKTPLCECASMLTGEVAHIVAGILADTLVNKQLIADLGVFNKSAAIAGAAIATGAVLAEAWCNVED